VSRDSHHSEQSISAKIEAYLSDELTGKERHQLEKAMLDDPFLADAVEGLASIEDAAKRKKLLTDIREKLQLKQEKMPLWVQYQKYAAAIVLMLVAASVFFIGPRLYDTLIENKNLSETTETEQAQPNVVEKKSGKKSVGDSMQRNKDLSEADAKEEIQQNEMINGQITADAESEDTSFDEAQIEPEKSETEESVGTQKENSVAATPRAELKELTEIKEVIEAEEDIWDNGFGMSDDLAESSDIAQDSSKSIAMQRQAVQESNRVRTLGRQKALMNSKAKKSESSITDGNRVITGTIKDIYGNPLPGVSVLVEGSTKGTVTDMNGQFNLPALASDDLLSISYIGFEEEEVALEKGDNELKITLDEDFSSLSEVVVTGYGKTQDTENETGSVTTLDRQGLGLPVTVSYPSPVGGMKAFKKYVKENLVYPKKAEDTGISGKVKLGFTITENGKVKDIEVLRSLGYGCDEEAIRLLKNGPDWHPKTVEGSPETSERTISIKFK